MGTASEIERLATGKAGIVASIRAKGVDVPETDRLDDLPARIDAIEGSSGVLELSVLKDATGLTGGLETTGKVTSATISPKAGSQVGKTVIYGSSQPVQGRLPEGYTELEYIESTGTQYINTESNPESDIEINIDFQLTEAPSENVAILGTKGNTQFTLRWVTDNFRVVMGSTGNFPSTLPGTDRYQAVVTGTKTTIGNDSVTTSAPDSIGEIFLSAYNYFGEAGNFSKLKLYSVRISTGETLEKDFVPCKNQSGEVGMYDVVGSKFYGNSGTGEFVAGSEIIVPDEPMSQVALTLNGQRWEIDLGGNTLGEGQVLTIGATGAAMIDGIEIPDQQMPTFAGGQVEIATASSMEHYFDLEYQPA